MQRGGKAQAVRRWKEGKASIRERPAFSMPERYCLSRRGKQYRENSQVSAEVFPEVPRGHPGYAPDAPRQFPCRAFRCSPDVFPQRSPSGFPSPPPKPPQAASPCSWACRRQLPPPPHSERNAAPKPPAHGAWVREHGAKGTGRRPCRPPLLMGLGRVNTGPKALAGGTAAPPTATRLQWSCSPAACRWRSGGRRPCRC